VQDRRGVEKNKKHREENKTILYTRPSKGTAFEAEGILCFQKAHTIPAKEKRGEHTPQKLNQSQFKKKGNDNKKKWRAVVP